MRRQVLGRVATLAARCSRASTNPCIPLHRYRGPRVSSMRRCKLTGRKEDQKIYRRHSGTRAFARGARRRASERQPIRPWEEAVRGMLPRPRWRRDVPQAEGLRRQGHRIRRNSPAHRGRITLALSNTTQRSPKTSTAAFSPPRSALLPSTIESSISTFRRTSSERWCAAAVLTESADKFDIVATVRRRRINGQAALFDSASPRAVRIQRRAPEAAEE